MTKELRDEIARIVSDFADKCEGDLDYLKFRSGDLAGAILALPLIKEALAHARQAEQRIQARD